MESSQDSNGVLLHILVVGFHHKKGCQVEFAYPPLVEGTDEDSGQLPNDWKYLPTLALPDGAHNYSKDTIYFHLKNRTGNKSTVYGVSCYRQIDAKDLMNKTEDITRDTVQKSVCVLTSLPLYGAVAAKLELITHAWFEQKDFSKVSLLKDAFLSLQNSISANTMETQAHLGINIHDVVKLYKHKILVLFKLILLERKVVFYMTPVQDLCNSILAVLSLFPGLLEKGMIESVRNTKTPLLSPTERRVGDIDDPYIDVQYSKDLSNQSSQEPTSCDPNQLNIQSQIADSSNQSQTTLDRGDQPESVLEAVDNLLINHADGHKEDKTLNGAPNISETDDLSCPTPGMSGVQNHSPPAAVHHMSDNNGNLPTTSQTFSIPDSHSKTAVTPPVWNANQTTHITKTQDMYAEELAVGGCELNTDDLDKEDEPCFSFDDKLTLVLKEEEIEQRYKQLCSDESTSNRNKKLLHKKPGLSIDITAAQQLEVVPVVSPTSISIDKGGYPLAIFTKGSVCHPYLSLSYFDILEDVNIRSFIIGASNVLFKQKKHMMDVLVEDSPNSIQIYSKELQKQLQLTTEDLRFADIIVKSVETTVASGTFLENTEWEGGDEWIRVQFKNYLQALMASILAEDTRSLEAYNIHFVNAWKSTHNYNVWRNTVQQLEDAIPGTERGRKINAAMDQAGKVAGGVMSSAKTYVSTWWTSLTSPEPQSDDSKSQFYGSKSK